MQIGETCTSRLPALRGQFLYFQLKAGLITHDYGSEAKIPVCIQQNLMNVNPDRFLVLLIGKLEDKA